MHFLGEAIDGSFECSFIGVNPAGLTGMQIRWGLACGGEVSAARCRVSRRAVYLNRVAMDY